MTTKEFRLLAKDEPVAKPNCENDLYNPSQPAAQNTGAKYSDQYAEIERISTVTKWPIGNQSFRAHS
jgi:hypothetical protein